MRDEARAPLRQSQIDIELSHITEAESVPIAATYWPTLSQLWWMSALAASAYNRLVFDIAVSVKAVENIFGPWRAELRR